MKPISDQARALIDTARSFEAPPPGTQDAVRSALQAKIAAGTAASLGAAGAGAAGHGTLAGATGLGLTAKIVVGTVVAVGLGTAGVAVIHKSRPKPPVAVVAPPPSVRSVAVAPPVPVAPSEPAPPPVETASTPVPTTSALRLHLTPPGPIRPAPTQPMAPVVEKAQVVEKAPDLIVSLPPTVAPLPAPPQVAPAPPTRTTSIPAPTAVPSPVTTAPSAGCGMAEEVQLLGAAERELQAHRPTAVLLRLDHAAEVCPGAELGEERLELRILALCELGRKDEARVATERLEHQAPHSPALGRIRAACQ